MEGVADLARRTLDELPLNLAIVAADGEIVATNRGWERFGDAAGRQTGDVGTNYFAAAAEDDAAVAGIRAVLAGDREVFAYEYPCHTPERPLWFLMRVTRFVHEGDPYAVVAHVDITERRLAELEIEHLLERIEGVVARVTATVVRADSRETLESELVSVVEHASGYDVAAVYRHDRVADEVAVTAEGRQSLGGPWPVDGDSPVARAYREQEPAVVSLDGAGGWAAAARVAGIHSLVAVPIATDATVFGLLLVGAADPDAFDERERRLLAAVGQIAGTAVRAIESASALTADRVVEAEVATTSDEHFFVRLASELDCSLSLHGTVPPDGGGPLLFFEVSDVDPQDVVAWAMDDPDVSGATVLATHGDDGGLVEFAVAEASVLFRLANRGVETTALTVEGGRARFALVFPTERDAREVVAVVDESDPELLAFHERDRPERSPREVWATVADSLTPRQRTALTKAYVGGFFDWPREATGDELADSMDITRSTFHQHLRAAERKVVGAFFEDPN
ncbi:MAG: bacterio-opsin activator domain-containing protein [Halanaeroarchaeum sp.]